MTYAVRLPGGLKGAILAWIVAEILVFVAVAHLIGLGGAILLGLLTTVLGVLTLRRVGLDAARSLRATVDGRQPKDGALLDGMLTALGALLLIWPGFIANFVGCALAAPSVRGWAARRFGGAMPTAGPRVRTRVSADVIDLAPEDWRPVDR